MPHDVSDVPAEADTEADTEADAEADTEADTEAGLPPVVRARGLTLEGGRGPVFAPVDLEIPPGALFVVAGPAGSGRTSLLLTLSGRMIPSAGELTVAGEALPRRRRAVQHAVTLGTLRGVNDLDAALTVEEHVLERLALTSPWWRLLTPDAGDVPAALAAVHQDGRPDLDPDAVVRDLTPYDRFRLGLALALAGRRRVRPRLLAVDDVDALRDPKAVDDAWRLLFSLTAAPGGDGEDFTVVASCTAAGTIPDEIRIDERTLVHRMRRPSKREELSA